MVVKGGCLVGRSQRPDGHGGLADAPRYRGLDPRVIEIDAGRFDRCLPVFHVGFRLHVLR